jgi:shikimate kinase
MAIVYLCGLPGSGKSTIGAMLAKLRGQPFIDLDKMIEERAGMDIPAIFSSLGEPKFRDFENIALVQAASRGDSVIALGGGALERKDNRDIVLASGMLIWLQAPISLLAARTLNQSNRPLLDANDTLLERVDRLRVIMEQRHEQFELAAMTFPTTDEDPMQTALTIHEAVDGLV